jgi:hypothetical protein
MSCIAPGFVPQSDAASRVSTGIYRRPSLLPFLVKLLPLLS